VGLFPLPLIDDRVATTDWQDEHPPAPSHLRVLYLGKILQDDETLTRMCFFLRVIKRVERLFTRPYRVQSLSSRLIPRRNPQRPRSCISPYARLCPEKTRL
jgi:hypothetical protein